MNTGEVIVATDVRKTYGRVDALRGITLDVRAGEIFGILGPNGAGKTTFIKCLVGSTRPSAGAISVLGLDPRTDSHALRRQIGYMPQAPALYEDLSPRQNLEFFARGHDIPHVHHRVDDALELTGLRERERDRVFTFSGGMKQRVSLACALVHEPKVLLLDEPTAGVDPKLRETFWEHFRALAAHGVTLIVSTHQMDEALACDRLAVLRGGEVLACETPRELLRRGRMRVTLRRGDAVDETTMSNDPLGLPDFLHRHGLDSSVTGIEIEQDSLEAIVLSLINSRERRAADAKTETDGHS